MRARRILSRAAFQRYIAHADESKCKAVLVRLKRHFDRMKAQEVPCRRVELMIDDVRLRLDYLSVYTPQNIFRAANADNINEA